MFDRNDLQNSQTLVVKVGSGVLSRIGGDLDRRTFCRLVAELSAIVHGGRRVALVSSGAVALGRARLGETKPDRERELPKLQALAAVGQTRLMHLYESEFAHYGLNCGQVLLTREGLDDRGRYLNARRTLRTLWELGCIPIINENDTVACHELRFGDNDRLASRVACLLDVDLLVICSDVDALYTSNPHVDPDATPLDVVSASDPVLDSFVSDTLDTIDGVGTGGMITKLGAARIAARRAIPTVVMNGKAPDLLPRLFEGERIGTLFSPDEQLHQQSRKAWISDLLVRGHLICDDGARDAVASRGKSLLPSGLKRIEGRFLEGDAVELRDASGQAFARGLAAYPDADMRRIIGCRSDEISKILGYRSTASVVHRDDLVLLNAEPSAPPSA